MKFIYFKKFKAGDIISENEDLYLLNINEIIDISLDILMFQLKTKDDIFHHVQFLTREKKLMETLEELEEYLNN